MLRALVLLAGIAMANVANADQYFGNCHGVGNGYLSMKWSASQLCSFLEVDMVSMNPNGGWRHKRGAVAPAATCVFELRESRKAQPFYVELRGSQAIIMNANHTVVSTCDGEFVENSTGGDDVDP